MEKLEIGPLMEKLKIGPLTEKYVHHHFFFDLDSKHDVLLDSIDSTRMFGIIFQNYGMD